MDGGAWWAIVHGVAESRIRLSNLPFTFHFHALEKEMATHSGVLAWRVPGTGEPGGLPSMGLHRVGHDWSDLAAAAAAAADLFSNKLRNDTQSYFLILVPSIIPCSYVFCSLSVSLQCPALNVWYVSTWRKISLQFSNLCVSSLIIFKELSLFLIFPKILWGIWE